MCCELMCSWLMISVFTAYDNVHLEPSTIITKNKLYSVKYWWISSDDVSHYLFYFITPSVINLLLVQKTYHTLRYIDIFIWDNIILKIINYFLNQFFKIKLHIFSIRVLLLSVGCYVEIFP